MRIAISSAECRTCPLGQTVRPVSASDTCPNECLTPLVVLVRIVNLTMADFDNSTATLFRSTLAKQLDLNLDQVSHVSFCIHSGVNLESASRLCISKGESRRSLDRFTTVHVSFELRLRQCKIFHFNASQQILLLLHGVQLPGNSAMSCDTLLRPGPFIQPIVACCVPFWYSTQKTTPSLLPFNTFSDLTPLPRCQVGLLQIAPGSVIATVAFLPPSGSNATALDPQSSLRIATALLSQSLDLGPPFSPYQTLTVLPTGQSAPPTPTATPAAPAPVVVKVKDTSWPWVVSLLVLSIAVLVAVLGVVGELVGNEVQSVRCMMYLIFLCRSSALSERKD
jgi:hypothetical protein